MAEKSEILFGTMLGDSATGGEEGEGIEPGELGTRMAEHGECVSVNGCLHSNFVSILQAILYCR